MIDELIGKVSEKTGLGEEQSRQAAEAVVDFLKERLPEPIAGQLDGVISGEGGGIADSVSGLAGGLFGGGGDSDSE